MPVSFLKQAASHLIRFFDVIRGTLMAPPNRLLPVMKMPLRLGEPGISVWHAD
jgi:hypothetical protein